MRTRLTICLIALAAAAAACTPIDDPQQVVSKLRILGVRADSPDVTYVLGPSGLPAFDPGAVKLDALVADPKGGGRPVFLYWAACGVVLSEMTQNFDCDGAHGLPLADATFRPLSYLGWLMQSQPSFDPSLLASSGVSSSHTAGLPVFTWLRATAGAETQASLKRITFIPSAARNLNPKLLGVTADDVPFGPGVTFKAGRQFTFLPQVDPASFEEYIDGLSGKSITEKPMMMWYSSDGKFGDLATYPPDYPDTTWRSPALDAGETERRVDFWFVLLDLRGGIDWLEVRGIRVVP